MIGGGDPFYLKFWVQRTPLERNKTAHRLAKVFELYIYDALRFVKKQFLHQLLDL